MAATAPNQSERRIGEIEQRIRGIGVQGGDQATMTELQQSFGERGDAGRSLQVADIGFDRTQTANASA